MNIEGMKALADAMEAEQNKDGKFWDKERHWRTCRDIVDLRYPKMNVMKQARLVGKMMDERFPVCSS